MNYLAHLYLAQPTADSSFGNLLGDFQRGVDRERLPPAVRRALKNHLLVDHYTDHHARVREAKRLFSRPHRRFAPIALDVLFDHFLIKDWHTYNSVDFDDYCHHRYALLQARHRQMPARMQRVVSHMSANHGLAGYRELDGVERALTFIADRLRFDNPFADSIDDVERHYDELYACFQAFFPDLIRHVAEHSPERESSV
ncbi:acyl carrier protein phosphodiesterase [Alteromonas sp. CYL-A6]|uniref:acyl carrier protein phosphodiesterase n=1 Tax=Alteromonas nitratireducens TaxID=3390813 RepID=UPI0034C478F7